MLKGSTARLKGTATWTSYKGLRDKLLADGMLEAAEQPNLLRFTEDVPFASPSAAAAVVYAGNQNGRVAWRAQGTGQTYGDWQEAKIKAAEPETQAAGQPG